MIRCLRRWLCRLALLLPVGSLAAAAESVPMHDTLELPSRALGEMRRVHVYRPPHYDAQPDARFPVLYMPDGGVAEDFPHVATTLDAGVRAGEIAPMLLVGIENTQRRRDMTPPTTVDEDRTIWPVVGESAKFRAFIRDELMPEIDRRYRSNGDTAIIGESLAGLFIVDTFFEAPGLFDTSIALSPSLWWNAHALVDAAPGRLRERTHQPERLYLSAADETDIVPHVDALADALKDHAPATLQWMHEPRPDLRHDNIYRSAAPGVLRRLFPLQVGADGR
ncbi:MAG TPA: alpha/beta hydrolase-fold protein [Pseudomonadota bacterium]|jgi:predicted alpha/beta superfamily hydrolase|nr:alpha/beta hydrolase-fold protein [Pseudomonadota bacterium]